jgi:hypothetical protein
MLEYTNTSNYKYHTDNDWQVRIYPLSEGYNVVLCRQSEDGLFHDKNLCNPQHCDTLEGAEFVAELMMGK